MQTKDLRQQLRTSDLSWGIVSQRFYFIKIKTNNPLVLINNFVIKQKAKYMYTLV